MDGPCGPVSIRVRCALRSRKGADAGADDAGAKGPPRRGGHNACKRTECCKKASPRGRRTRPRPVAMRPRRGPPRTGGPDQCVKVVKESHERRVPVSRLPVLSNRRSRKTSPVPSHVGENSRSTQNLRIGGTDSTSGQRECVKFGAGRLTARRPYPRRAVAGTRRQKFGPPGPGSVGENTSQNVRPPGDRGDSAARPRQDDDGRVSAWGEARTGSARCGPSKVAVTTDRGGHDRDSRRASGRPDENTG